MKKWKLSSLAVIGISMGLMTTGLAQGTNEKMTPQMQAFYEMLAPDAQKKFLELDTEHKKMALQVYHEYCKTMSQCKGHREQAVEEQHAHQMQQRQQTNQNFRKQ